MKMVNGTTTGRRWLRALAVAAPVMLMAACSSVTDTVSSATPSLFGNVAPGERWNYQGTITQVDLVPYFNGTAAAPGVDLAALAPLYRQHGWKPLWVTDARLTRARDLARFLTTTQGSAVADLDFDGQMRRLRDGQAGPDALAQFDLSLSQGAVRYLQAAEGLPPGTPPSADLVSRLEHAGSAPNPVTYLKAQGIEDAFGSALAQAENRYEQIQAQGGWPAIPAGQTLRPGMTDPRVPLLRRRLAMVNDYPAVDYTRAVTPVDSPSTVYDAALVAAVKQFQRRHGVTPDGALGKGTRQALNVPVSVRLAQLRLNQRRWGDLRRKLGNRYVLVNVPAYEAMVIEDGRQVLKMRTVVGRPEHKSPVFSDVIEYIVVNPTWTVPKSIGRNEMLPKLQEDAVGFLKSQHMSAYRGGKKVNPATASFTKSNIDSYTFVQAPGEWNALGKLKFMFPNSYSVYLHDTPGRHLFKPNRRAFSHGCIRCGKPVEFATYLLKDTDWTRAKIEEAIASGKTKTIHLKRDVPVHLTYFTAFGDQDGLVNFREDIYGRDNIKSARQAPAPAADDQAARRPVFLPWKQAAGYSG